MGETDRDDRTDVCVVKRGEKVKSKPTTMMTNTLVRSASGNPRATTNAVTLSSGHRGTRRCTAGPALVARNRLQGGIEEANTRSNVKVCAKGKGKKMNRQGKPGSQRPEIGVPPID